MRFSGQDSDWESTRESTLGICEALVNIPMRDLIRKLFWEYVMLFGKDSNGESIWESILGNV